MSSCFRFIRLKALFEIFLVISLSVIFSLEIGSLNSPSVIAENVGSSKVCCLKDKIGGSCSYTENSNCASDSQKYPGVCSDAPFCKPVCCDTGANGCSANMPLATCTAQGGNALDDAKCGYAQCGKGCCVIGNECSLETESSCRGLISGSGLDLNFKDDVTDEISCKNICKTQETVCCADSAGDCSTATRDECTKKDGESFSVYCSSVAKCSEKCAKHTSKGCDENDPGKVYWYDSCGNKEDGVSCNDGELCGKDSSGEYSCISGDCSNVDIGPSIFGSAKKDKKNNEAWCMGESLPGQDLPGSRQYIHQCINGKVKPIPVLREENQICLQINDGDKTIAMPVYLSGDKCSAPKIVTKEACEDTSNKQCTWNAGAKKCLPKAPVAKASEGTCGGANLDTSARWKEIHEWECSKNCFVYTNNFSTSMNSFCNTLGDCGANYNLAGQFSNDGFKRISNKDKIRVDENCAYAENNDCGDGTEPDAGQVEDDALCNDDELITNEYKSDNDDAPNNYCNDVQVEDGEKNEGSYRMLRDAEEKVSENNFNKYKTSFDKLINFDKWTYSMSLEDLKSSLGLAGQLTGTDWKGYFETAAIVATVGAVLALATYFIAIGTIGCSTGPWGCIIAAAIIVTILAIVWLLSSTTNEITPPVNVQCMPWVAPAGGNYCSLCHQAGINYRNESIDLTFNGTHECTKYLCESLGSACNFKDTVDGERCISMDCGKPTSAIMNPLKALEDKINSGGLKCVSAAVDGTDTPCKIEKAENNRGYTIKPFVKAKQTVPVGVTTTNSDGNAYAHCAYDIGNKDDMDKMSGTFKTYKSGDDLAINHFFNFTATNMITKKYDYQFYVLCKDACGNGKTGAPYKISFEYEKGPDHETPSFVGISPINNAKLIAGVNSTMVNLEIDESVISFKTFDGVNTGCKWARSDVPYKNMAYNFSCPVANTGENQKCLANFIDIKTGENKFYIKCMDTSGNANADSITGKEGYTLYSSVPLKLDDVKCTTEFGDGCSEIYSSNVTVKAFTSEGAESGKAKCGFSLANVSKVKETDFLFAKTDDKEHSIDLKALDLGSHPYYIVCEDAAGNTAKKLVDIKIMNDKKAPGFKSVYKEGSSIIIKTDEIATCKYALNGTFKFDSATLFDSTGNILHSANVGEDVKRINIGCEDRFGNRNSDVKVYLV